MAASALFHLAFPVSDIPTAKTFYVDGLGCQAGRKTSNSLILNLYGHQIVAHKTQNLEPQQSIYPRHFGLIFPQETDWEMLLNRAISHHLKFYQEEKRRFPGSTLEHRTFFLEDPFVNLLEFKYYCHESAIFGQTEHAQIGDSE
jgi:extradiol dioxygenase family protein